MFANNNYDSYFIKHESGNSRRSEARNVKPKKAVFGMYLFVTYLFSERTP